MLFQNPMDITEWNAMATKDEAYNDWVAYDGVLTTLELSYTGSTTAQDTLLKLTGTGTPHTDIWCPPKILKGVYADADCKADTDTAAPKTAAGTNDYVNK